MEDIGRKLAAIREDYIREATSRYDDDYNELDSVAESPIERLMAAALVVVFPDFIFWGGSPPSGSGASFVAAQVPLGNYARVDFVVWCRYENRAGHFAVIVECDGHDFHERTKEQARRDRSRDRGLQAAGWSVFRFTGAEIWEDPLKCARQVEQFVHRKRFE